MHSSANSTLFSEIFFQSFDACNRVARRKTFTPCSLKRWHGNNNPNLLSKGCRHSSANLTLLSGLFFRSLESLDACSRVAGWPPPAGGADASTAGLRRGRGWRPRAAGLASARGRGGGDLLVGLELALKPAKFIILLFCASCCCARAPRSPAIRFARSPAWPTRHPAIILISPVTRDAGRLLAGGACVGTGSLCPTLKHAPPSRPALLPV
jgi:hypothetical protein